MPPEIKDQQACTGNRDTLLSIGCETIATGFGVPWRSGLSLLIVIWTVPLAFYIGRSFGWLLFVARFEQSGVLTDLTPLRQLVLLGMLYLVVLWLLYHLLRYCAASLWRAHRARRPACLQRAVTAFGYAVVGVMLTFSIGVGAWMLQLCTVQTSLTPSSPTLSSSIAVDIGSSSKAAVVKPAKPAIDDGKTSRVASVGASSMAVNVPISVASPPAKQAETGEGKAASRWLKLLALALLSVGGWLIVLTVAFIVSVKRSQSTHSVAWAQPGGKLTLFGQQKRLFDELYEALESLAKKEQNAHKATYALRGGQGAGKSFLVNALEQVVSGRMEQRNADGDDAITATFNDGCSMALWELPFFKMSVWSEDAELRDLQFQVLRGLLLHPAVLFSPTWHAMMSLSFVGRLLARDIQKMFRAIRLKTANLELDIANGVPLPWQGHLQKLVSLCPCGAVVVLDEIDRTQPRTAQAALVMARSSLDLPGMLVIVPYVPEQIRYRVFNPLICETPDLQASLEAELWQDLLRSKRKEPDLRMLMGRSAFEDQIQEREQIDTEDYEALLSQRTGGKSRQIKRTKTVQPDRYAPPQEAQATLQQGLAAWYLERISKPGSLAFERFAQRFEEKYLSRQLNIAAVAPEEIPRLLRAVPDLNRFAEYFPDDQRLVQVCGKAREQSGGGNAAFNLRRFLGNLAERLSSLSEQNNATAETVCAVVAYEYYQMFRIGSGVED